MKEDKHLLKKLLRPCREVVLFHSRACRAFYDDQLPDISADTDDDSLYSEIDSLRYSKEYRHVVRQIGDILKSNLNKSDPLQHFADGDFLAGDSLDDLIEVWALDRWKSPTLFEDKQLEVEARRLCKWIYSEIISDELEEWLAIVPAEMVFREFPPLCDLGSFAIVNPSDPGECLGPDAALINLLSSQYGVRFAITPDIRCNYLEHSPMVTQDSPGHSAGRPQLVTKTANVVGDAL